MKAQIHTWLDRIRWLLVAHLAARRVPKTNQTPLISFSFDDVPLSVMQHAVPLLQKHDIRASFYVAGHFSETSPDHLQKTHIQTLIEQGHEIGCHTYSHLLTGRTSTKKLAQDIERNQSYFNRHFNGYPLKNFAYPKGSIGLWNKPILAKQYRSLRCNFSGINENMIDLNMLKANRFYSGMITKEKILSLINEAVQKKGWLIFYTHDVSDKPSPAGCTPALLEFAIEQARQTTANIVTIDEALNQL